MAGRRPIHKCSHDGCDLSFDRPSLLERHMRVHTGTKPFPCSACSRRFARMDSLRIHERTHEGKTGPFKVREYRRSADRAGAAAASVPTSKHALEDEEEEDSEEHEAVISPHVPTPSLAPPASHSGPLLASLPPSYTHSTLSASPGDMRPPTMMFGHPHAAFSPALSTAAYSPALSTSGFSPALTAAFSPSFNTAAFSPAFTTSSFSPAHSTSVFSPPASSALSYAHSRPPTSHLGSSHPLAYPQTTSSPTLPQHTHAHAHAHAQYAHRDHHHSAALSMPPPVAISHYPAAILPPNLQAFQVPNAQPQPYGPPSFAPPQLPMGVFSNPSPATQHRCPFCFETFLDQASADAHVVKHRTEAPCDCPFCQVVFSPQYLRGPPAHLSSCCLFDDDVLESILNSGLPLEVTADSLPRSVAA